ncbi:cytochrome P450 family protein [Ceratobasidium sp. AG-Ba]|nr:cytochrome P450 family protein [Ceratobasidium sp. AG-Ba]QRW14118.1 cytochrome P450 family protein [Ceratobasidium sp. AG-Ba]
MARFPDWLPGTGWKHIARKWGEEKDHVVDTAYFQAQSRIAAGEDQTSIVASIIKQAEALQLNPDEFDEYVKNTAFSLFGADTQQRAQEEIDAVVGSSRLPTIKDKGRLPYVDRLIEEVLRWRPVAPMGMPHASIQDDIYEGFFIPKGTIVIPNVWCGVVHAHNGENSHTNEICLYNTSRTMSHDERFYKNPEEFNPDRFLDPNVSLPPVFGFGRRYLHFLHSYFALSPGKNHRSCPGVQLAKAIMFLYIACILATFTIARAQDEEEEIDTMEGMANQLTL